MITTHSDSIASKLRCLRDHGAELSDLQRHLGPRPYLLSNHPEAGYNQRMTDIQAALGSMQMNRADEIIKERKSIAKIYNEEFKNLSFIAFLMFLGLGLENLLSNNSSSQMLGKVVICPIL